MNMMPNQRNILSAILRADLLAFAQKSFDHLYPGMKFEQNWHHEAISHELDRLMAGETRNLIINVPPRSLKSFLISIVLPAFMLGRNPAFKIICASYSQDLAIKHASDFRKIIDADWYRTTFSVAPDTKNTETEYQTAAGGFRYTTSVGGTLTGRGGDLIIIDDPLNAAEAYSKTSRQRVNDWFSGTAVSRLDDKRTGSIIIVAQRLHQEDLTGFLRDQGEWQLLVLPAIAPEDLEIPISPTKKHFWKNGTALDHSREPLVPVLAGLKRQLGMSAFNAQYLQEPLPQTGNMLRREWLRFLDSVPLAQSGQIVQSWDTAMKAGEANDNSACLTFLILRKNEWCLVDAYRDRLEFHDLTKKVVERARRFQPNAILIEDRVSGTSLIQEVKRRGLQGVIGIRPSIDKVSRMMGQTPKLEAGSLFLPRSAPWLDVFMSEYLSFPAARHDDQMDALSQFLEWQGNRECDDFEFDFGWGDSSPSTYDLPYWLGRY